MNRTTIPRPQFSLVLSTLVLLLAIPALAQFPPEMASARSIGFGSLGVTQIDASSYRVNPASLALVAGSGEKVVIVTPHVWGIDLSGWFSDHSVWAMGIAGSQNASNSPYGFGAGYWFGRYSLGDFTLTDEMGRETGVEESYSLSHNLVVAASYNGSVRMSAGANLQLLKDRMIDYQYANSSSTFALDLGILVAVPIFPPGTDLEAQPLSGWTFTPSVGFSLHNLMAKFKDDRNPSNEYKPNQYRRIGASVSAVYHDRGRQYYALTIAAESDAEMTDYYNGDLSNFHYGAEIGLFKLVSGRYGWVDYDYGDDYSAQEQYGLTVSTAGLANLFLTHGGTHHPYDDRSLLTRFEVEVTWAKYAKGGPYYLQGSSFLEANLVIRL